MVISGMNLGLLVGPFLGGIVYDRAGYNAVFEMILGFIAFDFLLRLGMIEKRSALRSDRSNETNPQVKKQPVSTQVVKPRHPKTSAGGNAKPIGEEHDERSPLLHRESNQPNAWLGNTFPTMTILIHSPRLMAAIGGSFTQTMLVTAFDPILPLFVHRTFGWGPTGGGLIFLTICLPALLGGLTGALADIYGPKFVSLIGFAIAIPSLAALSAITYDAIFMEVLLCVLLTFSGKYFPPSLR